MDSFAYGGLLASLPPEAFRRSWFVPAARRLLGLSLAILGVFTAHQYAQAVPETYISTWGMRSSEYATYSIVAWVPFAAIGVPPSAPPGRTGGLGRWLSWQPLVWMGRISYGMYLYHWFAGKVLDHWWDYLRDFPVLKALALFGLTIPVAWISWTFLERPILEHRDAVINRSRRRAATGGAPGRIQVEPFRCGLSVRPFSCWRNLACPGSSRFWRRIRHGGRFRFDTSPWSNIPVTMNPTAKRLAPQTRGRWLTGCGSAAVPLFGRAPRPERAPLDSSPRGRRIGCGTRRTLGDPRSRRTPGGEATPRTAAAHQHRLSRQGEELVLRDTTRAGVSAKNTQRTK